MDKYCFFVVQQYQKSRSWLGSWYRFVPYGNYWWIADPLLWSKLRPFDWCFANSNLFRRHADSSGMSAFFYIFPVVHFTSATITAVFSYNISFLRTLVISVRTVENHLSSIYQKTETTGRVQVINLIRVHAH
jgi:hypothetical protein